MDPKPLFWNKKFRAMTQQNAISLLVLDRDAEIEIDMGVWKVSTTFEDKGGNQFFCFVEIPWAIVDKIKAEMEKPIKPCKCGHPWSDHGVDEPCEGCIKEHREEDDCG